MLRAYVHACILHRIRDPEYRSYNLVDDPELAAAIQASIEEMNFDAAQIASAIEESKRIVENENAVSHNDAASSSSVTTVPSHQMTMFSVLSLSDAGLRIVGSIKPMPLGIARDSDIRKRLKMIDVFPDGNCGAYALSIINFAVHGVALTHVDVRNRLIELAKHHIINSKLYLSYVAATRMQDDGSVRYLEQPELALFCESLKINCIVFGLRREGRRQNYTAFSHVIDHTRPYAVFVNTCGGNHYEVVVELGRQNNTFSLLLDSNDVASFLAIHAVSIDKSAIESPPDAWFQNYEYVSEDFIFTEPSVSQKSNKKQKKM